MTPHLMFAWKSLIKLLSPLIHFMQAQPPHRILGTLRIERTGDEESELHAVRYQQMNTDYGAIQFSFWVGPIDINKCFEYQESARHYATSVLQTWRNNRGSDDVTFRNGGVSDIGDTTVAAGDKLRSGLQLCDDVQLRKHLAKILLRLSFWYWN